MTMRIAIIGGSGHWTIARDGLAERPEAHLCAVAPGHADEDIAALLADPDIARRAPARYGDYRDLLEKERPDIVVVNPFYHLHAAVTLAALMAGAHVFSEKPLALNLAELAAIDRARLASGRLVSMMLGFRDDPLFRAARRLVREGAIGEPLAGYAQKSYKLGVRPSMYNRRETFGGIIPWVGIHAIDWFRWVSGVEYAAVTAFHRNCHAPQHPGMEDVAGCLFELANGGSAVMSFDYLRPETASTHGDDRLRLVGAAGCLDIAGTGSFVTDARGTRVLDPAPPTCGIFADVLDAAARGGEARVVTSDEAIAVTRLALLAREAADTGRRIALTAPAEAGR